MISANGYRRKRQKEIRRKRNSNRTVDLYRREEIKKINNRTNKKEEINRTIDLYNTREEIKKLDENIQMLFTSDETIKKLSSYKLTEEEVEILKYGLKHPIKPKHLLKTDIFATFEQFIVPCRGI